MKSVEFCYWLQGLFELAKPVTLDAEQTEMVKRHLGMVFIHEIDPSYPASQTPALDKAHGHSLLDPRPSPLTQQRPGDVLMRC